MGHESTTSLNNFESTEKMTIRKLVIRKYIYGKWNILISYPFIFSLIL